VLWLERSGWRMLDENEKVRSEGKSKGDSKGKIWPMIFNLFSNNFNDFQQPVCIKNENFFMN